MPAAKINELQKELLALPPEKLLEIISRLAKYKKENKELLTYLLFEAHDEAGFIEKIKTETEEQLLGMNTSNLYLAKKTIRKVLRLINKNIRYSGKKQTEVELRLYYCRKLKDSGIKISGSQVLVNLYDGQIKKINEALETFHEDLKFDYVDELKKIM